MESGTSGVAEASPDPIMTGKPFTLESIEDRSPVKPKEPLYSLLCEASATALNYLYADLTTFDDDSALDDIIPSTGLTRSDTIAQVLLVRGARERMKELHSHD